MPGRPRVGIPEYLQGWVPDIEFLDCATIVDSGSDVCVPLDCFRNTLTTHERSPLDPAGGIQVKVHAPQVGIVQIGAIGDPEGETLVARGAQHAQLASELREANREAHILDQRGLQCSEVYSQTTPVEGPDDGDYGTVHLSSARALARDRRGDDPGALRAAAGAISPAPSLAGRATAPGSTTRSSRPGASGRSSTRAGRATTPFAS